MICSDTFRNTLYYRTTGNPFPGAGKKENASDKAELFKLAQGEAKEEEPVKKRGKQSLLDDAKAAGKEQETSPQTETESKIVVKPDGSKVLVITVRCGASVKVKSLKISDPTDFEGEEEPKGTMPEITGTGDVQGELSEEGIPVQMEGVPDSL